MTWEGTKITGTLLNEPAHVPGLHQGATVKVDEGSVFDYLHGLPDGGVEGNETQAMLGVEP
jgi:uncharacterized protein YegJ (DUF2314 family)